MDALAPTVRSPKKRILVRFDDGPGLSQDSFVDEPSAIASGTDEEAVDGPAFVNDTNNNQVAFADLDKSIGNPSGASAASSTLLNLDSASSILEELEQFAKEFKEMRIKRGFTQLEVATLLAVINPNVSQSTVSRFESMGLSFTNIINLKPYFELFKAKIAKDMAERKTLTDKDDDQGFFDFSFDDDEIKPPPPKVKRYKRTEISAQMHRTFEKCFLANPQPSPEEIQVISEYCQMESRVVRVWFCNQRRKEANKERYA